MPDDPKAEPTSDDLPPEGNVPVIDVTRWFDDDEGTDGGGQRFFRKMDAIDRRTKERGKPASDVVLWTSLLQEPLEPLNSRGAIHVKCWKLPEEIGDFNIKINIS